MKYFIPYLLIGLISFAIDFLIFKFLISHLNIYLSNFVSIYIASVFSFLMNANFNFKRKDNKVKRYMKFVLIIIFGVFISSICIRLSLIFFSPLVSKLITLPFVACAQFTLNTIWTFRE